MWLTCDPNNEITHPRRPAVSIQTLEEALRTDPLAIRLQHLHVHPLPVGFGENVLTGDTTVAQAHRRHRGALGTVVFAVVVLVTVAVTPVGAAIGRAILPQGMQQRLGLIAGAPNQLAPPVAGHQAQPGGLITPHLTLQQVQSQVGFTIPLPTRLPPGLAFIGALTESRESAFLYFTNPTHTASIGLAVTQGLSQGGPAAPASAVRTTSVAGASAFFVQGSYEDAGQGTTATWNPAADYQALSWQRGGFTFTLTAAGLRFSSADLVLVADGVQ
jgi:hypothetical protein